MQTDYFKVYGASKEGTEKYLLEMLAGFQDGNGVNKLKNEKIVIVLPDTITQINNLKNDEKEEKYKELKKSIDECTILINLDVKLLEFNLYNILSAYTLKFNAIETKKKRLKAVSYAYKEGSSSPLLKECFTNSSIELLNTSIISDFEEIKNLYFNLKLMFKVILNDCFRFNIAETITSNIEKPVEVLGLFCTYRGKYVYTFNLKKLEYNAISKIYNTILKFI